MPSDTTPCTHMAASEDFDVIYLLEVANTSLYLAFASTFPYYSRECASQITGSKSLFDKDERAGRCLVLSDHRALGVTSLGILL